MTRRLAALALVAAALAGFLLLREPTKDAAAGPAAGEPRPRAPRAPERPATVTPSVPARNVFEYAAPPAASRPTSPRPPAATAPAVETHPAPAPPAEDPVRLVGLVNRGGRLRAALSIRGEVVVLGPGEAAEGYRVLSIDEDAGVRLREPDGTERALTSPRR